MSVNSLETIQHIAWLDQVIIEAGKRRKLLHDALDDDARQMYADRGVAPAYTAPDVAKVTSKISHPAVKIKDVEPFTQWVADNFPEQLQTVVMVREAYVGRLAKIAKPAGDGKVKHPDTGEIIPGLEYDKGGRFIGVSVIVERAAKEVYAAIAEQAVDIAESAAGPGLGFELAALDAAETPGHLAPGEVL